ARVMGHAEWASGDWPGVDDFLEYECRLNDIIPQHKDAVICLYDLTKCGGNLIIDVMRTHPMILIGGIVQENPFFVPPDEFLRELSARPAAGGIFRYGLSVVLVALSTGLTLLLQDYTFRTPLFLPAILLSTWFGGTGPGLFAVLLSTLFVNFFILEPRFAFSFSFRDAVHLAVFLFTALL